MRTTALILRLLAAAIFGVGGAALMLALVALGARPAQAEPVSPQGNGGAVAQGISAGNNYACVWMSNGRLLCWGQNGNGKLGDGTTTSRNMPVDVLNITGGASMIAAGANHTCAVVGGAALCWGANSVGQLGTGNTTASTIPTNVVGLSSNVTTITAGSSHTCAVVGGAALCWGDDTYGQLGNGGAPPSTVPTNVVGLSSGVTAIAGGYQHTCAVVSGAAQCWGRNGNGQLGTGNTTNSNAPVNVVGLASGVTAIAASRHGDSHSCAIVNGGVQCWGDNFYGQLGTGNTVNSTVPTNVVGLPAGSGVLAIAVGGPHTCALTSGGGVKCWGANFSGQLGISSTVAMSVPVDVMGLTSGVTAIAAGDSHTCAVLAGGGVKCWGVGSALGAGFSAPNATTPRDVLGLSDFCIFTAAIGNNWADARNWSNCGGVTPQTGDAAVIGRASTSGVIPQVYATTTVSLNRLHLIGSFNLYGPVTANHVFNSNPANLNPNNFQVNVISPASLTVTQALTWPMGLLDGTGFVVIQPGATGNASGAGGSSVPVLRARFRNYGVLNLLNAEQGSAWTNEAGGVVNFNGGGCCSASGVFTNYGVINVNGVNRVQPIIQYGGVVNLQGTITETANFVAVTLYGGVLSGTGAISDGVHNIGGVVAPGGLGAAGALTIEDWYVQSPTATLNIDIGGSITGTFDQLNVLNTGEQPFYPGRADLSGTLNINRLGGFVPQSGDQIRFMTFGQRVGFFGAFNNAFGPAFIPAAYSTYVALVEGGGGAVGLYAKADNYSVTPGSDNSYSIVFENPFTQTITLQALTHTLPVSVTYKPGSTQGGFGDPTITTVNGRQQLRWNPSGAIPATSLYTFKFGVTTNVSATTGPYTSTLSARTSAGLQDLTLNNAAPFLIQTPFLTQTTFTVAGQVTPRPGLPPAINLTRAQQNDWFLITTKINCPPGRTCTNPDTDIFSVTLKIAGYSYTMTKGTPPPTPPTGAPAEAVSEGEPLVSPAWANPPDYFHWNPGWPCDQQLPKERCDSGPDNPYRTPTCPIPIVVLVHWTDGTTTAELIGCMALYDPSGYVRDLVTGQPITNATVSLYRVPFALPDTSTQTRNCRTVETRPGGVGGNWNSLPPADLNSGALEDASLTPPRIDPPVNPQATNAQGHYGWDVMTGCWFVVVSAPGYITKVSPVVGVPPAVTDLDIYLIPDYPNKVYLPCVRR